MADQWEQVTRLSATVKEFARSEGWTCGDAADGIYHRGDERFIVAYCADGFAKFGHLGTATRRPYIDSPGGHGDQDKLLEIVRGLLRRPVEESPDPSE